MAYKVEMRKKKWKWGSCLIFIVIDYHNGSCLGKEASEPLTPFGREAGGKLKEIEEYGRSVIAWNQEPRSEKVPQLPQAPSHPLQILLWDYGACGMDRKTKCRDGTEQPSCLPPLLSFPSCSCWESPWPICQLNEASWIEVQQDQ